MHAEMRGGNWSEEDGLHGVDSMCLPVPAVQGPDKIRQCEDKPMSNLLLSMLGAVAEFERSMIRERQREGIELAKKKVSTRAGNHH